MSTLPPAAIAALCAETTFINAVALAAEHARELVEEYAPAAHEETIIEAGPELAEVELDCAA